MNEPNVEVIEDIEEIDFTKVFKKGIKLEVEEGDVLIFELSDSVRFPETIYVNMVEQLKIMFPNNKCLVLAHNEFKAIMRKKVCGNDISISRSIR